MPSMTTGLRIASSGMSAQRIRLNLIASNLANAHTTRTAEGGPYQRKDPIFAATPVDGGLAAAGDVGAAAGAAGVEVVEVRADTSPGALVHDPSHPDADAQGNVHMPNVNPVEEMVNMITASRSFEANVSAFRTLRDMVQRALEIGR